MIVEGGGRAVAIAAHMGSSPDAALPAALGPFSAELRALGAALRADRRPEDVHHFRRILWVGRALGLLGLATCWMGVNPLSVVALAISLSIRWTVVAHHILHGAFDGHPGAPASWSSRAFGEGPRRVLDWFDWMPPGAWRYEHNSLHHHRLGEVHDPDVPEEVFGWLRRAALPRPVAVPLVLLSAMFWRIFYYGPNCVRQAYARELRESGGPYDPSDMRLWSLRHPLGRRVWRESLLPVLAWRFGLPTLLALPFGASVAVAVLVNLLLAELLCGLHTFVIVVPSHAGGDVLRFDTPPRGRDEAELRQIFGTVDFGTGGVVRDVLHGYLNYQVAHHVWPDLSPAQLVRAQPALAELCARHGVPYRQESVWVRLGRLLKNILGEEDMVRVPSLLGPPRAP